MEIAVTGTDGFIGKNFIHNFSNISGYKINKITRKTSKKKITSILDKSKIIYHFAGANRPLKKISFKKDNVILTKFICDYLIKKKLETKIIFTSSSQALQNNHYGKSKKACEDILIDLSKKNNSKVFILRLPHIFGKWSKPNYNSVVSTFCYNVARKKKLLVLNPKQKIYLLYIDDLIKFLQKFLKNTEIKKKIIYDKFPLTKKVSIKKIAEIIYDLDRKRTNLFVGNISTDFRKNLYSTYVSFLPKNKISYPLKSNKDIRGSFTEFLKTKHNGQLSIFTAKSGQVRGHHFHHSKVEKFLVLKGKAKFYMSDISTNKKISFIMNGNFPKVVESVPGHQHYIKNIGTSELLVLLWSNEIFDVNNSDTFSI